ncbi:MAG: FHA domain-containing protein [Phototrophicaceae bacterium]|jgi:pSer/pThr/pTyr-binding forkhead associated (FHA) protein
MERQLRIKWKDKSTGVTYQETASPPIVIGRDASQCQVVLKDTKVSGRHACITIENNEIVLRDLGSTNGTHYLGRRLSKNTPEVINIDDTFTVFDILVQVTRPKETPHGSDQPLSPNPPQSPAPAAASVAEVRPLGSILSTHEIEQYWLECPECGSLIEPTMHNCPRDGAILAGAKTVVR